VGLAGRAGPAERYSAPDPTVAPPGHSLVQAQLPLGTGEAGAGGLRRLERMLDPGYPGWRDRQAWRRRAIANGHSGALDLPGRTWRDRPRVERGDGVFLAGDMVAAPGLLSEVAFNSALTAARGALGLAESTRRGRRMQRSAGHGTCSLVTPRSSRSAGTGTNGISRYWARDVEVAKDQRVGARMSASQPKTTRGRTR
jgi:hypothetical protein